MFLSANVHFVNELRTYANDNEILNIIQICLHEIYNDMDILRVYIHTGDEENAQSIIHKLKGTLSNSGVFTHILHKKLNLRDNYLALCVLEHELPRVFSELTSMVHT